MKKLLITGSNGFIGKACEKYFLNKGFDVFGIDIFGEGKNFIKGEVSRKNIEKFDAEFDFIIHLAGSATVGVAHKNSEAEREKTVGSTKEVLEYIYFNNENAKLVYSSSSAVYGDGYKRKISENDILMPISEYGKHKVEAEMLCNEYFNKYGVNVSIIRFFSVYGEGLKKQLLWDFSNRLRKNGGQMVCFGTGKEIRDFIHIQDAVKFIDLVLDDKQDCEVYNCGNGKGVEIKEVLNQICKNFECEKELVFDNITQEGNPKYLLADITKARKINFYPDVDINEGIKRYATWFKKEN